MCKSTRKFPRVRLTNRFELSIRIIEEASPAGMEKIAMAEDSQGPVQAEPLTGDAAAGGSPEVALPELDSEQKTSFATKESSLNWFSGFIARALASRGCLSRQIRIESP